MADASRSFSDRSRLEALERALSRHASELAVFLVYDRPSLVAEKPGLARTYFAERCVPNEQLDAICGALWSVGAHAEIFEGDHQFLKALVDGHHERVDRRTQIAYNGLGYSVGPGAFRAGRKSLIPLIADSYGLLCANSDPYACAFTLHKFHSFTLLQALGVRAPQTWQYRINGGWVYGKPPPGKNVIVKSTYESWAIGVTDESVFIVDDTCDQRVSAIAAEIGQDATVQEFISGPEVYVPVLSAPHSIATPPMESVLTRAPGDPNAFVTVADNLGVDSIHYRPFEADESLGNRLQRSAVAIFDLLQLEGLGRIDFRVDSGGRPWVTDIAISPGLEAGGAAAKSLAVLGFDHPEFIRLAIAASLAAQKALSA